MDTCSIEKKTDTIGKNYIIALICDIIIGGQTEAVQERLLGTGRREKWEALI